MHTMTLRLGIVAGLLSLGAGMTVSAQHVGPVTGIAVADDAVYSCSQAGVVVSSLEGGGSDAQVLFRPDFRVTSLAWSAASDGFLFVGGGVPGVSGMIGVYDLKSGAFRELKVGEDLVYSVDVRHDGSPAGLRGAVACADYRVLTVALPGLDGESIEVEHRHTAAARVVRFSPEGEWLASGGLDGAVLLSRAGEADQPLVLQDHSAKVESLAFAPEGTEFASGARDGRVRVHAVEGGRLLRTYQDLGADEVDSPDRSTLSLAWGGDPPGVLVAGTATGDLYRLSTVDDRCSLIARPRSGPVFSLAVARREPLGVWTGTVAEVVDRVTLRGWE